MRSSKRILLRFYKRQIGGFINPKLKFIEQQKKKGADKLLKTRLARIDQRINNDKGVVVKGLSKGYRYVPETDAELAILLAAQPEIIKKIGKYEMLDYNDQGSFDCVFFDETKEEKIQVELEPTLEAFLGHNNTKGIELIVTWRRGNWKVEKKKKGKPGLLKLVNDKDKGAGFYKLLEYVSEKSIKPRNSYPVVVLEEML